jgi:hypothetical protein
VRLSHSLQRNNPQTHARSTHSNNATQFVVSDVQPCNSKRGDCNPETLAKHLATGSDLFYLMSLRLPPGGLPDSWPARSNRDRHRPRRCRRRCPVTYSIRALPRRRWVGFRAQQIPPPWCITTATSNSPTLTFSAANVRFHLVLLAALQHLSTVYRWAVYSLLPTRRPKFRHTNRSVHQDREPDPQLSRAAVEHQSPSSGDPRRARESWPGRAHNTDRLRPHEAPKVQIYGMPCLRVARFVMLFFSLAPCADPSACSGGSSLTTPCRGSRCHDPHLVHGIH